MLNELLSFLSILSSSASPHKCPFIINEVSASHQLFCDQMMLIIG